MVDAPADGFVEWTEDVNDVLTGDLTAAVSYSTPAGGAVATAVAPCGLADRAAGTVGFTTSLGFGKKLERIVREPRIALAYHSREHGRSDRASFVLVQGEASVDLTPSQERLDAFAPQATRYLGEIKRGPVWDRLLREYYNERVFVDVAVRRIVAWPELLASGTPALFGPGSPPAAPPQTPPSRGVGPRIDVDDAAGRLARLPHRLVTFKGSDGYPVIAPIELAGHDDDGLHLVVAEGTLPVGGRRAGLLAHAYRPQLVGLTTRVFTGWMEVGTDGSVVYAPHTSRGFSAPPSKNLLLVINGLMAKYGLRKARRTGFEDRLRALASAREDASAG
jgi:hypothetical protein